MNLNFNNFTIKSKKAIKIAKKISKKNKNQYIEIGHLILGLLEIKDDFIFFFRKKK
nr:Clp protease N-terminal domain-containing protein [Candidatus Shikimatogenerans silvanidophilus]